MKSWFGGVAEGRFGSPRPKANPDLNLRGGGGSVANKTIQLQLKSYSSKDLMLHENQKLDGNASIDDECQS